MIGTYTISLSKTQLYIPVSNEKSHNSEQLWSDYNVFNTNLRGKNEFFHLILIKISQVGWYYYTIFQVGKLSNKEITWEWCIVWFQKLPS